MHFPLGGCAPLSWELRLKIAIGAARGLAFLHASEKQVIYRDFKASNILLDAVSSMLCNVFFFTELEGPKPLQANVMQICNVPLIYQFAIKVKY